MSGSCDVIVMGGGHAGCEVAAAPARMSAHTAPPPCPSRPSARCLDGLTGRVADKAGLNLKGRLDSDPVVAYNDLRKGRDAMSSLWKKMVRCAEVISACASRCPTCGEPCVGGTHPGGQHS